MNELNDILRLISQGDYAEAINLLKKLQKKAESLDDLILLANVHNGRAALCIRQGKLQDAQKHYERALELATDEKNKSALAFAKNGLGRIEWRRGRFNQALRWYQEALVLRLDLGDTAGVASTVGNIGLIYASKSNYDKAAEFYQQAVDAYEEIGKLDDLALTLNNFAYVEAQRGRTASAQQKAERSLELCQKHGFQSILSHVLDTRAKVAMILGDNQQAASLQERAITLQEDLGSIPQVEMLMNYLEILLRNQNFHEAEKILEKAEVLAQENRSKLETAQTLLGRAECLLVRSEVCGETNLIPQTERRYQMALELASSQSFHLVEIGARLGLARIFLRRGDLLGANEEFSYCVASAQARGAIPVLVDVLQLVGLGHAAQDSFSEGRKVLNEALDLAKAHGLEAQSKSCSINLEKITYAESLSTSLTQLDQGFKSGVISTEKGIEDDLQEFLNQLFVLTRLAFFSS
ncbi:MAG: tetratricopeptide repeat protein [Candidatus Hodarchaeota archaeon]